MGTIAAGRRDSIKTIQLYYFSTIEPCTSIQMKQIKNWFVNFRSSPGNNSSSEGVVTCEVWMTPKWVFGNNVVSRHLFRCRSGSLSAFQFDADPDPDKDPDPVV